MHYQHSKWNNKFDIKIHIGLQVIIYQCDVISNIQKIYIKIVNKAYLCNSSANQFSRYGK